jgi:hypothetical protein
VLAVGPDVYGLWPDRGFVVFVVARDTRCDVYGVNLQVRSKGYIEHELVVDIALYPVFAAFGTGRGGFALVQVLWLRCFEERPYATEVAVGVQQIQATYVHLICDIRVSSWKTCSPPASPAAGTCLAKASGAAIILGLGCETLDRFGELGGVRAAVLAYLLTVLENDECGGAAALLLGH